VIGQLVGKYRIAEPIGEGGMGMVYRAEHVVLGSPAAIKLLLPRWTRNRQIVDRFFTEARAASAIRHVGIVQVFDSGLLPNGQAYIAMEMLEGISLGELLDRERALPPALASAICCQILAALDAAHVVGVIHRDLKPDNIQLVHDASAPASLRVKLLDFGIAKLLLDNVGAAGRRAVTSGGVLLGTPAYMSPEQCRASAVDSRSDLYAAGCILFEMLTGAQPFDGETSTDIVTKHLHDPPPKLRSINPSLPVELEQLIERMLAKDPARRAPSAAWSLATLERVPLESIETVRQMLPPPPPRRAASLGLPASAFGVVLPDTPLPEGVARLSAMAAMGRDPRTRTPVMSDSGTFAGYRLPSGGPGGRFRPSAEMSAASMSAMPAWRRKLPLIIVVVAVLIALVVILVIGHSGELPPLPPPPSR
jgi:eukaryotic-like serine/threonine-protein kinase